MCLLILFLLILFTPVWLALYVIGCLIAAILRNE